MKLSLAVVLLALIATSLVHSAPTDREIPTEREIWTWKLEDCRAQSEDGLAMYIVGFLVKKVALANKELASVIKKL